MRSLSLWSVAMHVGGWFVHHLLPLVLSWLDQRGHRTAAQGAPLRARRQGDPVLTALPPDVDDDNEDDDVDVDDDNDDAYDQDDNEDADSTDEEEDADSVVRGATRRVGR